MPTVLANRPQAIAVVQQAPVETLPSVPQESLIQIGFAAREDITTFAMFAANFSPPVASNPVPTATAAAGIRECGFHSDRKFRSGAHRPQHKYRRKRQRYRRAIDRPSMRRSTRLWRTAQASMFGFDESLLDLLASVLLGS